MSRTGHQDARTLSRWGDPAGKGRSPLVDQGSAHQAGMSPPPLPGSGERGLISTGLFYVCLAARPQIRLSEATRMFPLNGGIESADPADPARPFLRPHAARNSRSFCPDRL